MKKIILALMTASFLITFYGCGKKCDMSFRVGEVVQIPIQFNNFTLAEIDNILVYRIDKSNNNVKDTARLTYFLWANKARSTNEIITESGGSSKNYYESTLHNCDLIFDWHSGQDTLSNIEIIKSKENVSGCHKNDPNVKIDKLTFLHKGKVVVKGETIQMNK